MFQTDTHDRQTCLWERCFVFKHVLVLATLSSLLTVYLSACEDVYSRACRLFSECNSPFYNMRTFVDHNCPKTCGRCGK